MLTRAASDRQAFYGCLAGSTDQFLSLDPGCEGRTQLGREGWLYTSPPAGRRDRAAVPLPAPGHRPLREPGRRLRGPAHRAGCSATLRTDGPEPPPEPLRLTCAPNAARATALARGRSVRRVRFGGRERLAGRVRNGGGSPAAGATVLILIGDRNPVVFAQTVAGPDGRYRVRVRPGKNRIFRAGFRATRRVPGPRLQPARARSTCGRA